MQSMSPSKMIQRSENRTLTREREWNVMPDIADRISCSIHRNTLAVVYLCSGARASPFAQLESVETFLKALNQRYTFATFAYRMKLIYDCLIFDYYLS